MTTLIEACIIVSSMAYLVTDNLAALIVWETIATLYLLIGFIATRHRSLTGRRDAGRRGILDTLSWVLPLAASLVGISAAIQLLILRGTMEPPQDQNVVLAAAASLAVVLSWHLLHTGFAQVYETLMAKYPTERGLDFPSKPTPNFADFLYFSFTIGTSFATSDTTVNTSRIRWTVLIHSIISFFYNALVVAVALNVIQQLAGS